MVDIKKLSLDNAEILSSLANNKKIWDNLRDYIPYPYTVEDANDFIKAQIEVDPTITFGIHFNDDFCGIIGINKMKDVYSHSAEIGYWIGEPYWGKGITTKAVKLMVDYCFETLSLIRLYTGVFDFNKASMIVLEKNGFQHEGSLKLAVKKNGKLVDEIRYGLINPNHQ